MWLTRSGGWCGCAGRDRRQDAARLLRPSNWPTGAHGLERKGLIVVSTCMTMGSQMGEMMEEEVLQDTEVIFRCACKEALSWALLMLITVGWCTMHSV